MKPILIVGGGPAGLAAGKSLVDKGSDIVLVERTESLGGRARDWTCKGLSECRNCGVCYAKDRATELLSQPRAEILLLANVTSAQKTDAGYSVKIKSSPRYVTDDCVGCGKCVEICPVEEKAISPPTGSGEPRVYWIARDRCLHFKKGKCSACSEVCPTKAIDFEDRARNVTREVGAIVYATGIEPVEACEVNRLGCGRYPNVMSSVDVEKMLNEKGMLARPSDGKSPKKIAVIQCVGSRSVKLGVEYCSKFCCKYATKISQLILDLDPTVNLDFYFMDLRTLYEPQDEFKVWAKAKKTVKLIRSMPASVFEKPDSGNLLVRVANEKDLEINENEYELVILSVGMRPESLADDLPKSLGIAADAMGFATGLAQLEKDRVYIVGAITKPMDIEESVIGAIAASARVSEKEGSQ